MASSYQFLDVTEKAKEICKNNKVKDLDKAENGEKFGWIERRFEGFKGSIDGKVSVPVIETLRIQGHEDLNLSFVEQLVEKGQTQFIAELMKSSKLGGLIKNSSFQILQVFTDPKQEETLICIISLQSF
jgi:hypothetical protein